MITNRIMSLKVVDGIPMVPGAVDVSAQVDGLFIAYGAFVKGVTTKLKRGPEQVHAYVQEMKPGVYAVFADKTAFATIDPDSKGVVMTTYKLDAAKIREWPVWYCSGTREGKPWSGVLKVATPVGALPWAVGDITVTIAKPAVPSTVGDVDMQGCLDTATVAAVIP